MKPPQNRFAMAAAITGAVLVALGCALVWQLKHFFSLRAPLPVREWLDSRQWWSAL